MKHHFVIILNSLLVIVGIYGCSSDKTEQCHQEGEQLCDSLSVLYECQPDHQFIPIGKCIAPCDENDKDYCVNQDNSFECHLIKDYD